MATSDNSSLTVIAQRITIYLGLPICAAGVIGCTLNIIVFLSLKTFRESACAFYLTIMAFFSIAQLITGFFTRILINGFLIDWTIYSTFYCKFRIYCVTVSTSMSFTCICLATIDQFLATHTKPRWQQWSNTRVAHRVTGIFTIIWMVHSIPYCIYYDRIESKVIHRQICTSSNEILQQYHVRVYISILTGFLPILVCTLFGLLACYNINHLAYRTVPLIRRELDKQLTVIVLMQTLIVFFTTVPYVIVNILSEDPNIMRDPSNFIRIQFVSTLTTCPSYGNFASQFYLNICVSKRFRQQFVYVIFKNHCNRQRERIIPINQIAPYP